MTTPPSTRQEVTQLLGEWSGGDEGALEKLIPLVQPELHRLAHHYMSRERAGHTLQTTALLNEAYLRQLEILSASRDKARREIRDQVLSLLADKPRGRPVVRIGMSRYFPT